MIFKNIAPAFLLSAALLCLATAGCESVVEPENDSRVEIQNGKDGEPGKPGTGNNRGTDGTDNNRGTDGRGVDGKPGTGGQRGADGTAEPGTGNPGRTGNTRGTAEPGNGQRGTDGRGADGVPGRGADGKNGGSANAADGKNGESSTTAAGKNGESGNGADGKPGTGGQRGADGGSANGADGKSVTATGKSGGTVRGSGKVVSVTRKLMPFKSLVVWAGDRVEITQGKSPSLTIETEEKVISLLESAIEEGTLHLRWKSGSNTLVGGPQTSTVTVNGKKIIAPAGSSVSISDNTIRIDGVIIDVNRPIKLIKLQKPVVLRLTVTDLSQITTARTTQITCKGLRTQSLNLLVSGSSRVSIGQLTADDVSIRGSGSGSVSLAGTARQQTIRISGSAVVEASRLSGNLATVRATGSGNATVAVTNSLDVRISGSARVSYSGSPDITKRISGSGKLVKGN